MLARCSLVEKLYTLSLQKFKPMKLVLLAEDCVKLLTNDLADGEVRSSLQQIIDKKKREDQSIRKYWRGKQSGYVCAFCKIPFHRVDMQDRLFVAKTDSLYGKSKGGQLYYSNDLFVGY